MWLQGSSRCGRLTVLLLLASVSAGADTATSQGKTALPGVVVEEVAKDSAGEKAGIKPGDVLLSWVRAATPPANPEEARGEINSPFDLVEIELEQASRGETTVIGIRGSASFSIIVPWGTWGITARAHLIEPLLSAYEEGKRLIAAKEIDKGLANWREMAERATRVNDGELAAWLLRKVGDALADVRRWDEAHASYQAAIEVLEQRGARPFVARVWDARGSTFERQNDLPKAEAAYREALQIREQLNPATLAVAANFTSLGAVAFGRGNMAAAEESFTKALALRERLAPDSLVVAAALNNLGTVARSRGDLSAAEALRKRALVIQETRAPGSVQVAMTLTNLGVAAADRGDLAAAEEAYKGSLAIVEKLAPDSLTVGITLNNLGLVALERGHLATAEEFLRRALAFYERLAPDSVRVAGTLTNLGLVARERGDLSAAEEAHRRSLAISDKLAPDSPEVAAALNNLGGVAFERRDLTVAEEVYRRSLAIHEKLAPDSLFVAASLRSIGAVMEARGDSAAAQMSVSRALVIEEKLAPGSLAVASSLESLADLARDRGDLTTSEAHYLRTLEIRQHLASGSTAEARALHSLALLSRRTARHALAGNYLHRAITAIEAQTASVGGDEEVRTSFAAGYADYYRDYVDLLLETSQPFEAFAVLERSRARSLLAMLAERDLVFAGDLPAELARERAVMHTDYDRTQAAIALLNPAKDAAEIDRLLARLRELRDKREAIARTIRKASPRFASLHYPQPLDLAGAQQSLDAGTVLLAFCVTKDKTFLFVVQPGQPRVVPRAPQVSVFSLPIGEMTLREKVAAFRSVIQRGPEADRGSTAPTLAIGKELFDALIKPAEELIGASERVVISPDGPLHALPFGALVQSDRSSLGPVRYFIEWKPLHVVASATVYAELKKARRETGNGPASTTLVAFGDPTYPRPERAETLTNPDVRAVVRGGYALQSLPASRAEVEGIARLYGGQATTYLGDQATEERAKAIGKGVRYIHFASHGLLDERFPLNSALALTIPERPSEGQANGLLQAWEIFEQMRIDADLVTLSACETGLGKEMGGEGLVGLTRAFQYAGARTVLASLWSVGDESTADLMTRFYRHLRAGKTKDDALRTAQLELIRTSPSRETARGPATRASAHPYHWAAFQLIGDWK
jgi:CHAT domain-containing protein/Tfp pilus assembly protein PilF